VEPQREKKAEEGEEKQIVAKYPSRLQKLFERTEGKAEAVQWTMA
jgi:hypothetical protein